MEGCGELRADRVKYQIVARRNDDAWQKSLGNYADRVRRRLCRDRESWTAHFR
jgi:hypothetical protein